MTRNSPTGSGSRATRSNSSPRRTPDAKRVQYTPARTLARLRGRCPPRPDQLGNRRWPIFRRILAALRSRCSPALPVSVHVGRVSASVHGWCTREPHWFSIRLSGRLSQDAAVDVLVHEWAHAMSWDRQLDRVARSRRTSASELEAAAHGPAWGVAYARAYLVFAQEVTCIRRERYLAARRKA